MARINNPLDEVRIPFAKMSFTPDVPSTALGPNEYNQGLNVETDVRGIRSVAGEQEFFDALEGTPTYISCGFRADTNFWFIVATTEGKWWATYNGTWSDITPAGGDFTGYTQATNITEAWNGTVPFFNDTFNPPMVWLDGDSTLTLYSNLLPADVDDIVYSSPTEQYLTFADTFVSTGSSITGTTLTIGAVSGGTNTIKVGQYISGTGVLPGTKITANINGFSGGSTWIVNQTQTVAATTITGGPYDQIPYLAGSKIVISGVSGVYDGTFTVSSSILLGIIYQASPVAGYTGSGSVAPLYAWNYNPYWSSYHADWMRMYSTPNVGSILVAGNLTATNSNTAATELYPVTIQWSQAFGLNQAPLTWEPTITNVANQLEVPLRGPALDAFPSNGKFFLCSYWDTVVFSPLNYSTTSAPILGVSLYNQGRGLLSSNCWANTDREVYGVDARDIWVFDGNGFTGIGNQRVKNWFYDQLDPAYYNRVFMETNSQKNQIEIYYPDLTSTGWCNKMISWRYDLQIWNPPKDIMYACNACEAPKYVDGDFKYASRTVTYARGGVSNQKLVETGVGNSFINNQPIPTLFERTNLSLVTERGPIPYGNKVYVHRLLPEISGSGSIDITVGGANSTAQEPTYGQVGHVDVVTDSPWVTTQQNNVRTVSVKIESNNSTDAWNLTALNWQTTIVEDAF